jgi:hypothetical protein
MCPIVWCAASCAVARVVCLLAGVSNAKLYRPVSHLFLSPMMNAVKKEKRKQSKNHRSKAKRACLLAEQMKHKMRELQRSGPW